MPGDPETLGARPRGRPSLYDAAYSARVLELAAEGCCKAEIAAKLGVAAEGSMPGPPCILSSAMHCAAHGPSNTLGGLKPAARA